MLYLYDEAIVDRFREIFQDPRISIQPPENAIRFVSQLSDDDVKFPLLSLNRTGYSIRSSDVNWAQSRTGVANRINCDGTINVMRNIPISMEYQLDVYTVDKISNDEIYRELLFYFLKNPTLEVKIPYTVEGKHVFNLRFRDDVVDNSDTVEHINKGVLYRNTSVWYCDDAYLFEGTNEFTRIGVPSVEVEKREEEKT